MSKPSESRQRRWFYANLNMLSGTAQALVRDCETTIKIKFALFGGVGRGGREVNCPKTLFFLGNAMTRRHAKGGITKGGVA